MLTANDKQSQQWLTETTTCPIRKAVMHNLHSKRRIYSSDLLNPVSYMFVFGATPPPLQWAMASSFTRFLDHTQRRITVGRTPLEEWSARRRDLYLPTHNAHKRHPCPRWDSNSQSHQTYSLDHAAIETRTPSVMEYKNSLLSQHAAINSCPKPD